MTIGIYHLIIDFGGRVRESASSSEPSLISTPGMRHSNSKISVAELKEYVCIRLLVALGGGHGSVESF